MGVREKNGIKFLEKCIQYFAGGVDGRKMRSIGMGGITAPRFLPRPGGGRREGRCLDGGGVDAKETRIFSRVSRNGRKEDEHGGEVWSERRGGGCVEGGEAPLLAAVPSPRR